MARKMQQFLALALLTFLTMVLSGACMEDASEDDYTDVYIDTAGSTGFLVRVPAKDLEITDPATYQDRLAEIEAFAKERGKPLRFIPEGAVAAELNSIYGGGSGVEPQSVDGDGPPKQPQWEREVWGYKITGGCTPKDKKPWVSGCVSQYIPHCNLRLNTVPSDNSKGALLFDLHIAKWFDQNGKFCIGFYQSAKPQWEYCPCLPYAQNVWEAYQDIRDQIFHAFLAVGIGALTAAFLADISAPFMVAALAA